MKNEPNQVSKCHGAKMEFETNPGRTVKGGYDLRPVCFVCRQPCEPVPAGDHPIGVNNMVGQPVSSYGDAIMAEREKHGWRCGKCDGANAPEHSKHCPERADCEFCGKEIPPADEPEGLEEVIDKWFDEKAGRLSVLIDLQNLIKSLLSKERAESDIPACTDHDEIRAKAVREFADGLEREIGEMGFVFDFPPQLLAIEEALKLIRSKGRPEEENKP